MRISLGAQSLAAKQLGQVGVSSASLLLNSIFSRMPVSACVSSGMMVFQGEFKILLDAFLQMITTEPSVIEAWLQQRKSTTKKLYGS